MVGRARIGDGNEVRLLGGVGDLRLLLGGKLLVVTFLLYIVYGDGLI
jgi:hypothetical protein